MKQIFGFSVLNPVESAEKNYDTKIQFCPAKTDVIFNGNLIHSILTRLLNLFENLAFCLVQLLPILFHSQLETLKFYL